MKFGKIDPIALGVSLGALSGISTFLWDCWYYFLIKGNLLMGLWEQYILTMILPLSNAYSAEWAHLLVPL